MGISDFYFMEAPPEDPKEEPDKDDDGNIEKSDSKPKKPKHSKATDSSGGGSGLSKSGKNKDSGDDAVFGTQVLAFTVPEGVSSCGLLNTLQER